jgi:hypothetical protein
VYNHYHRCTINITLITMHLHRQFEQPSPTNLAGR